MDMSIDLNCTLEIGCLVIFQLVNVWMNIYVHDEMQTMNDALNRLHLSLCFACDLHTLHVKGLIVILN